MDLKEKEPIIGDWIPGILAVALGISLGGCTGGGMPSAKDAKTRDLIPGVRIVYTANVDGEIEPCGCRTNPTGGLTRRWNLLQSKIAGERLSVDSGDLFYKSAPIPPFLEAQWNLQAETLATAYEKMGVEVFAPGELDFAAGLERFRMLAGIARFKTVSANLFVKESGKLAFDPYVILAKGGRKVAIFGIYDDALAVPPELEARDAKSSAREIMRKLRGQAEVVIALTHQGLDKDLELARQESGIDAIFGAHTQSFLLQPEKAGDTLVFQTSFRGQHVGVFENGENGLYQVDARFDSRPGSFTVMDQLVAETKEKIAVLNKRSETELLAGPAGPDSKPTFQTFAKCASCHVSQFEFHRKTSHFRAFQALVTAKQASNLECLKCHTVGAQQDGGWGSVNQLVLNAAGHAVDAPSFAASLPALPIRALAKTSKSFLNVQCENCHGPAGEHPFSQSYPKTVPISRCLSCHTEERAPGWYKTGKPDTDLIKAKLKSMTCPRSRS